MKAILALIPLLPAPDPRIPEIPALQLLPEEVGFYFFGLDIVSLSAVSLVY
jgi:hypothetical protein